MHACKGCRLSLTFKFCDFMNWSYFDFRYMDYKEAASGRCSRTTRGDAKAQSYNVFFCWKFLDALASLELVVMLTKLQFFREI